MNSITRESCEAFFGTEDGEYSADEAAFAVTYTNDEGATVFGHGGVQPLVVCIAAAIRHLSEQSGESVGDIIRQARGILSVVARRKANRPIN